MSRPCSQHFRAFLGLLLVIICAGYLGCGTTTPSDGGTSEPLAGCTCWDTSIDIGEISSTTGTEETSSERRYISQDADGTMYVHGGITQGSEHFITTPTEGRVRTFPSPITVGATLAWTVVYDDGVKWRSVGSVVAIERITVPAGEFVAARIHTSESVTWAADADGDGRIETQSTRWFVPELGVEVRTEADQKTTYDNGLWYSICVAGELVETNVPYTGSAEPDGEPPTLSSAFIRAYQPGDSWSYHSRGEVTPGGTTVVGTTIFTMLADTVTDLAGNSVAVLRVTTTATTNAGF